MGKIRPWSSRSPGRPGSEADRAGRLALARALGRAGNYGEALEASRPWRQPRAGDFDRFVDGVLAGDEPPAAGFIAQSLAREAFREGAPSPGASSGRAGARLFVALQLYEDALILMADAGLSMMDSLSRELARKRSKARGSSGPPWLSSRRGSRCSPMLEHSALLGRGSRCA